VLALLAGLAAAAGGAAAGTATVVDGLARVEKDGTLVIDGRPVRLFGIFIPLIDRTCRTSLRPPRCTSKAVLVLDGKVDGFVRCEIVGRATDGVPEGICGIRGRDPFGPRQDLAALLLQEGFALVAPTAPPEYYALERLAQSRGLGLWGEGSLNLR
jgi:endonuclease YncB( thermonuclease family)